MKKIYFFLFFIIAAYSVQSQTYQVTTGNSTTSSVCNSVKYDSSDGGTINAGYITDSLTGESDCYIVKLSKTQQIVWQKAIPSPGNDHVNKVIVCANGDYIIVGVLTINNITRGFVSRLSKATGNIIWSAITNYSDIGEIFYDVIETKDGNIAISGTDHYSPSQTNILVVMLNSSGKTLWSKISTYGNSDEPYTLNQLPNGNLIIGGFRWVGYYYAVVLELAKTTGSVLHENAYDINTTAPNSGAPINSIWPIGITVKDGEVNILTDLFYGDGTTPSMGVYTYDTLTKNLTGNIYYHSSDVNTLSYSFTALGKQDFLISQSFSGPNRVYVSRIINNSVVYDNLVNSSVGQINGVDTADVNAVFCGQTVQSNTISTYNLFATRTDFSASTSCNITSAKMLVLQPSILAAFTDSAIALDSAAALDTITLFNQNSTNILAEICGSTLPVSLLNFTASFNNVSKTTVLNWQTANEVNNNHFEVERSADNKNFVSIGNVAGAKAATKASYTFTDVKPLSGINFYRLKQVDNDGKYTYSKIEFINFRVISSFVIYPNPATATVNLLIPQSNSASTITVYDVNGKKLMEQQVTSNATQKQLDVSRLPSGVYNVILTQNENRTSVKMIKK